jgi:hypothetical protein
VKCHQSGEAYSPGALIVVMRECSRALREEDALLRAL